MGPARYDELDVGPSVDERSPLSAIDSGEESDAEAVSGRQGVRQYVDSGVRYLHESTEESAVVFGVRLTLTLRRVMSEFRNRNGRPVTET